MPPSLSGRTYDSDRPESMDFLETTQYNSTPSSSSANRGSNYQTPLPRSWREYRHPNGDIYFYNRELRLITPDNVRDPEMLRYIMDAREDHLQCLAGDPNVHRLPRDYELVISEVNESAAVIRMYSRTAGAAYIWTEEAGLIVKTRENFWSYVAEFPSHHDNLPPGTENEFAQALQDAKVAIGNGAIFPFSERQIDQMIHRYQYLTNLRSRGRNVSPSLAWLIGAVMPLDAVGRVVNNQNLGYLTTRV
ncbi:hypothetical protein JR316_0004239 [Psilocybe cubensis]|uniref:WW domain-containing protein n=2 Tax=Psilocybe cubensis TaxID=181762 RepID=A0A8H7XXI8_PSICU|nr:hypothetical protein JR316_0004239 [Psilocybe cubensis]KAH9482144.1 hypothetical protein JR316_0004239 [Psilocybe cubensis]